MFDATSGTDVVDRGAIVAASNQRVGNGHRRENVPRCTAARHHGEGGVARERFSGLIRRRSAHVSVTSRCGRR